MGVCGVVDGGIVNKIMVLLITLIYNVSYCCRDLEPYDEVSVTVDVTPWRLGEKQLIASFNSDQLTDIKGYTYVKVK